jgi:DNA-binding beta-propeller fold protein YncE
VASDQGGNIWIANCGNNSVTIYPDGDPRRARNLGGKQLGLGKPFDVAIDGRGRAWVTGNDSGGVAIIDGDAIRHVSDKAFDQLMGIASDSRGNMWVANSILVDVPCPDGGPAPGKPIGSVILISANGTVAPGSPFTGGGVTVPWGLAVDGDDNVWVANFGSGRGNVGPRLLRLSEFCGTNPANCPPGKRTGDPISPATGYTSDGLTRMTAAAIDPSGNVWVTDNWKIVPPPNNPGGNAIMIFLGLAAPIQTPLIGPPRKFD